MKRSPPWSRGRRCWRGRTFRVSRRRGGRVVGGRFSRSAPSGYLVPPDLPSRCAGHSSRRRRPHSFPPLPSIPPPEPLRASELRDRAREATVLGSLARAEELLQRAVALDPADASVWNDLGVVLVRRGQHLRGIEAIQRSLALDSQNAEAHRNLAVALEQDGQALGAAAHYRAFLALAPGHLDPAQIEQRLRSGPAE